MRHRRSYADTFTKAIFTLMLQWSYCGEGWGPQFPTGLAQSLMNRTAGKQLELCLGRDDEQDDILCIRIKGQTNKGDAAVTVCYSPLMRRRKGTNPFTGIWK